MEEELRHTGVVYTPDLEVELRRLQEQLSDLQLAYNIKKQAATHFSGSNYAGTHTHTQTHKLEREMHSHFL